jgi:hypothetical protein
MATLSMTQTVLQATTLRTARWVRRVASGTESNDETAPDRRAQACDRQLAAGASPRCNETLRSEH